MSDLVMPNNALFGLAIQQSGAGTEHEKMVAGFEVPNTTDNQFYYFPLTGANFAPVKQQENLPPEVGGRALPSGAYVTGVWAEGGASMIARLGNRIGWPLLAITGDVSTISDIKAEDLVICGGDGVADTSGINCHQFRFYSDDQFFVPHLTLRRLLPHPTAGEQVGEVAQDCRVRTGTITVAAGQPVSLDLDLIGRVKQSNYVFEINPGWSATFDDYQHFAVATCDGHFKVNDTEFKARNISVSFTNQLLASARSTRVGSVHPTGYPVLGRMVNVTVTFQVENYDLYLSTFTGATVDTDASSGENPACIVYNADVDIMVASQTAIGAAGDADEPYRLRVVSNRDQDNVAWQIRPLAIVPNQPVEIQATADFQATETGDPIYVILQNSQANYELP